jgi:hypothetical protein
MSIQFSHECFCIVLVVVLMVVGKKKEILGKDGLRFVFTVKNRFKLWHLEHHTLHPMPN